MTQPPLSNTRAFSPVTLTALALCLGVAGCGGGSETPSDALELGNLSPANAVPKSSPRQFVAAFEKFCLDARGQTGGMDTILRAADYVPLPKRRANDAEVYVGDDKRPLVMLRTGNLWDSCAVGAASRTGQVAAIHRMIAQRFPGAVELDPADVGKGTEDAWQVAPNQIIATSRDIPLERPSKLILAIGTKH